MQTLGGKSISPLKHAALFDILDIASRNFLEFRRPFAPGITGRANGFITGKVDFL